MSQGLAPPLPSTIKMPLPEQIIAGKYRIIQRIGSGGMGLVFLAEQLGVGKRVALKFLDPEPNEDDTRIARFLREAKVGLEVQHPGAAQVLDLGRDESMRLYLCFEMVEGEDLRDLIKREGRLSFAESRDIALQVAQVLAFAHERGIVHRDIKPENLRIRRDLVASHVKVLDFGIARLLKDTGMRLTAEGMLAGTPRYMSPEQVKDEPFDGRADQYALGLVFYEMLTGTVAIGGKNITQILMHQMQTVVPPLAFADPPLANPVVDQFIAKACAKDRKDRYATMAEFIEALKNLRLEEHSWPAPRQPFPQGAAAVPMKDMKVQSSAPTPAPISLGEFDLSDTLVRVPERTELERRVEVPTDPVREPVQRGVRSGVTTQPPEETAPLPAHVPSPRPSVAFGDRTTDPNQVRLADRPIPKLEVTPLEKSSSKRGQKPPPPVADEPRVELPTEPERPAVARAGTTVPAKREPVHVAHTPLGNPNQTVMGMAVPQRNSSRAAWWFLGVLVGLVTMAAAWWLFGRG